MGTNYDAHVNTCECCGKAEKVIHIGKSSFGWTFTFRGYRNQDPEDCNDREPGIDIKSKKEWARFLSGPNVKIVDEYGETVFFSEFMMLVQTKQECERNHAKYALAGHQPWALSERDKSRYWLDEEGYSFSDVEFS